MDFEIFKKRLEYIYSEIKDTCLECGRDEQALRILPVTKGQGIWAVEYAERYGFESIGENWIQEAVSKKEHYTGKIQWECIGHLQRNKAKLAVLHFDRIQSIDSLKLASRVDALAKEIGKTQRILMEVNTGLDPNKFGVLPANAEALLEGILKLENLAIEGLMTIAPLEESADRAFFGLAELKHKFENDFKIKLPELSMGMSSDFKTAIKAGSTLLRMGTALFGMRQKKQE